MWYHLISRKNIMIEFHVNIISMMIENEISHDWCALDVSLYSSRLDGSRRQSTYKIKIAKQIANDLNHTITQDFAISQPWCTQITDKSVKKHPSLFNSSLGLVEGWGTERHYALNLTQLTINMSNSSNSPCSFRYRDNIGRSSSNRRWPGNVDA